MTQKKGPDEIPRPKSNLHIAILGAAELADDTQSPAQLERFTPDPPEVADAWKNTPTRSDRPTMVADPGSGVVTEPAKDEVTRPVRASALSAAVASDGRNSLGALAEMAHRGRRKK